jgi:hypothetical protein
MTKKEYVLGYFLDERHIEGAYKLLTKQIEQDSPLYNTLEFKIFRQDPKISTFDPKIFYNNFVLNDVFYYFQDNLYLLNYLGVQSAYKVRNYHFLSFEILIIYYAIGLYLQEVLNQYHTDFEAILLRTNSKTYYGGTLNYKEPQNSAIFYYDDYQKFITKKQELTQPETGKVKYVISLDIRSFFYTIIHKKLLAIIDENATKITKKALRYDENSIASIEFFLKYLMKSSIGIPVSSQNIVSSYLSSVYFAPFDQYIIDEYLSKPNIDYLRYVDDFYLIYTIDSSIQPDKARNELYIIENDLADFLSNELGLNVSNDKSKRTKIDDLTSYYDFLALTRSTSPNEVEYVEVQIDDIAQEKSVEGKTIPQIFKECVDIIKKVKIGLTDYKKLDIDKKEADFLNNILIHEKVRDYSKSKPAIDLIDKNDLFTTYTSFDYILIKIKVFLFLISHSEKSRKYFHQLILKESLHNKNVNQQLMLIERFVLQLEFLSSKDPKEKVISKQEIIDYKNDYKQIISTYLVTHTSNIYSKILLKLFDNTLELIDFNPIYSVSLLNQDENTSLMQQIKQRHLNEKLDFFNAGFNHMLNEFQNIVEAVYFNKKKVDALAIRDKLIEKKHKVCEILFVSDFFKRRNQNSISHSNDPELGFWGVSEVEYKEYKEKIIPMIKYLITMI